MQIIRNDERSNRGQCMARIGRNFLDVEIHPEVVEIHPEVVVISVGEEKDFKKAEGLVKGYMKGGSNCVKKETVHNAKGDILFNKMTYEVLRRMK